MKSILITISIIIGSLNSGFAQQTDSIKIALNRAKILEELTQLRDSITHSLMSFDNHTNQGTAIRRVRLSNGRKELITYRDRVNLDIEETESTAQNSWTEESEKRMKVNMIATRREFNRLRAML